MPRVLTNSRHTRVFTDSYHTMRCQSVIKSIICGLHPMIILPQNSFVFKPKAFWMLHLNDHFIFKTMCLLWAANFGVAPQALHAYTLSRALTVGIMYNHIYRGLSPEGVSISACYYPTHISFSCIQPWDSVGRRPTIPSPPNQSPNAVLIITLHSHPFNAMSLCICNAMSSCICNAMSHCMLYHATCIMNAT